jgi:hypothetical protein
MLNLLIAVLPSSVVLSPGLASPLIAGRQFRLDPPRELVFALRTEVRYATIVGEAKG